MGDGGREALAKPRPGSAAEVAAVALAAAEAAAAEALQRTALASWAAHWAVRRSEAGGIVVCQVPGT